MLAPRKQPVEDRFQPIALLRVALDCRGGFLGREQREPCALAEHGPDRGRSEEEELHGFPPLGRVVGHQAPGFFGEVKQDGVGLVSSSASFVIDDDGHLAVGTQRYKVGGELLPLPRVDHLSDTATLSSPPSSRGTQCISPLASKTSVATAPTCRTTCYATSGPSARTTSALPATIDGARTTRETSISFAPFALTASAAQIPRNGDSGTHRPSHPAMRPLLDESCFDAIVSA